MKAQHVFFPKIMNGASQFVIPVFQRDYSWMEENCRQLWKDILLIAEAPGERGHFIGSVVYIQSPRLDADTKMIREMERDELKVRAASRRLDKVEMTDEARLLFDTLQDRIKTDFPEVIEMPESKSISYHAQDFFLEVIPRKRGLSLLVGIDYNEVDGPDEKVEDTANYSFVTNASYQGGVLINLRDQDQMEHAMRVIVQAHTLISGAG